MSTIETGEISKNIKWAFNRIKRDFDSHIQNEMEFFLYTKPNRFGEFKHGLQTAVDHVNRQALINNANQKGQAIAESMLKVYDVDTLRTAMNRYNSFKNGLVNGIWTLAKRLLSDNMAIEALFNSKLSEIMSKAFLNTINQKSLIFAISASIAGFAVSKLSKTAEA